MKVHYEFLTDKRAGAKKFADVEVSNDLGAVILELERQERNRNRAETRRHVSYSNDNDKIDSLMDNSVDIENEVIKNFEYDKLHEAINHLLPQQRELINMVFFQGVSHTELAECEGVTRQAIEDRIKRVLKKLKKFMK